MSSKKQESITISGEEYFDIIGEFVQDYNNRIISDDSIYLTLSLDKDKVLVRKFELELCIILIVITMRLYSIKHTSDRAQGYALVNILTKVGKSVFNFNEKEQEQFENLYSEKVEIYKQIAPEGKTSYDIRTTWLGFSRFLVSLFSDKEEEENKELIQNLSKYIVEFADIISRLIASSRLKVSSAWAGKYEFVVKK